MSKKKYKKYKKVYHKLTEKTLEKKETTNNLDFILDLIEERTKNSKEPIQKIVELNKEVLKREIKTEKGNFEILLKLDNIIFGENKTILDLIENSYFQFLTSSFSLLDFNLSISKENKLISEFEIKIITEKGTNNEYSTMVIISEIFNEKLEKRAKCFDVFLLEKSVEHFLFEIYGTKYLEKVKKNAVILKNKEKIIFYNYLEEDITKPVLEIILWLIYKVLKIEERIIRKIEKKVILKRI